MPLQTSLKGLVWYPAAEFEAAGYTVPTTWAELTTLSEQMVADGRTPWCVALESAEFSGWPGTDWVEALVLRMAGVEAYDRWAAHEVPFDAPFVQEATARFGEVVFGPGFVRGGPELVTRLSYADAAFPMFSEPPGCWLYHQASFLQHELPPGAELGTDVDFFPLPPMEQGGDTPFLGGGYVMGAVSDRPEIRELSAPFCAPSGDRCGPRIRAAISCRRTRGSIPGSARARRRPPPPTTCGCVSARRHRPRWKRANGASMRPI